MSLAEWNELKKNCTWTWTTQNGVNGVKVTGTNGNSIFMPAGGRNYGSQGLRDLGEYGCYWTSTLSSSNGTNSSAQFMLFYSRGKGAEGRNRINGMTIRPVTSDATGILNVKVGIQSAHSAYNLNGQRLEAPQKGINIIDGKKVVVK